jgi:hypothetical protein
MITDRIAAKIAKLMINAKTRTLVAKIVEAAIAERTRDIVITLEDDGQADAAELIRANY